MINETNKESRYTLRLSSKTLKALHTRAGRKEMKLSDYLRYLIDLGMDAENKQRDAR